MCWKKKKKETVSLVLLNTPYTQQLNYSMIWYWSNVNYEQNMHYLRSLNIYFSTTYNMSDYGIKYTTLIHILELLLHQRRVITAYPTNMWKL